MERDAWDDFSGDEDEEQSGRSQLEKLTRAALTQEDGFLLGDAEQEEEDDRPLPSARWQDPEEDWIVDGYLAEEEKEKKQKKEVKVKKEKEQRYKLGFGSVEEMILEDSEDDDNNDTKPTLSRNNSDSNSSTSSSSSPSSTKRKASSLEPLSDVKPEKKPKIKRDSDSAPPPQPRSESRECMICQRELLGSEVAFQKHVNDCIGTSLIFLSSRSSSTILRVSFEVQMPTARARRRNRRTSKQGCSALRNLRKFKWSEKRKARNDLLFSAPRFSFY